MNWKSILFVALCSALGAASSIEDKGPPYFVDRYGPPTSTETVSKEPFIDDHRGSVVVRGQFSKRYFRKDKLRVEAVFFMPSLKLAGVTFRMPQLWTEEQIEAALKAYGGEWKPIKKGGVVKSWEAPDGSNAVWLLSSLHIQSKAVVDAVAKELAEHDAKRKAVPTF